MNDTKVLTWLADHQATLTCGDAYIVVDCLAGERVTCPRYHGTSRLAAVRRAVELAASGRWGLAR